METQKSPLLTVDKLVTHYFTDEGVVKAVDGLDLVVYSGEIIGLVGESGCGKSVTSLSIMKLIEAPGKIVSGKILFGEKDLVPLSDFEMQSIRGASISMIFQQPQSCLNPVYTIGSQIEEVFHIHGRISKKEASKKAVELLKLVGIPDAENKAKAYPHEMSGGQAQRVMIAMALALNPKLLIADEPTTALDVTIQAQILNLLTNLREKFDTSIILITHDLGVIAEMADRVAIMYAGKIVEQSTVVDLFDHPMHPYTRGLIASVPVMGEIKEKLDTIPGNVPNLIGLPKGCRFASRCELRKKFNLTICTEIDPELVETHGTGHLTRCWLYQNGPGHVAPEIPNH
ncbi:MAG TPA: ABC transporter ATP-binding protein [Anaerolineales bacterium]|nr:ABC transporter ATP-binding protein [Anaerolineales bacterium]